MNQLNQQEPAVSPPQCGRYDGRWVSIQQGGTRPRGEVTVLLHRWTAGDDRALDQLLPRVYSELRDLAARYLRRERADHTLPPTGLVHEAYLRLVGTREADEVIDNRVHFFAVAAQAMRRILIEHARHHAAVRRPTPADRLTFEELGEGGQAPDPTVKILAVHQALERLQEIHPRQAQVVELKYFGGLSEEEVARVLQISRATVTRDWRVARLLLSRILRPEERML